MHKEGAYELAQRILAKARDLGITIGCAESCTGGLIASALTEVPGSSESFVGGIVSYWVDVKESILGVPDGVIQEFGVVSEQTAQAMARGACSVLSCDIAVATTGIAGPTGGLPEKPLGTVCFAVENSNLHRSLTTCEGSTRREVREIATITALQSLEAALDDIRLAR